MVYVIHTSLSPKTTWLGGWGLSLSFGVATEMIASRLRSNFNLSPPGVNGQQKLLNRLGSALCTFSYAFSFA